jgi:hypothetical protein
MAEGHLPQFLMQVVQYAIESSCEELSDGAANTDCASGTAPSIVFFVETTSPDGQGHSAPPLPIFTSNPGRVVAPASIDICRYEKETAPQGWNSPTFL